MRILYVSHSHPSEGEILENVGGMQRVSQQLVRELQKAESVEVVTETIHVSGSGIGLKTFTFLVEKLFELPYRIQEAEADVVLFSSMVTASLAAFIRNRIAIPMVTINHGRDVTLPVGIYQKFVPRVFNSLDGVISVSNATRQECLKRGMDADKGVALPNGLDLKKLSIYPEKQISRDQMNQKFSIPVKNRFILLTVGRKVKRKGHEWFIKEVMPKLGPEVIYVTIGDGPQLESIQRAVEKSPQKERIFILGRQPDEVLKKAYAAADLFIMPNIPVEGDMEGFGIVLLEANMAGNPAVASDLEGIRDVITQGENGYRVPSLDASGFVEKIHEFQQKDLNKLAERSRDFVQEQFSWEHVAQEYINYLETVISRYKGSI